MIYAMHYIECMPVFILDLILSLEYWDNFFHFLGIDLPVETSLTVDHDVVCDGLKFEAMHVFFNLNGFEEKGIVN